MSKSNYLSKREIEKLLEGQENKLNKLLSDFNIHKGSTDYIEKCITKTKGVIGFLKTLLESHQLSEKTKEYDTKK